MIQIQKPKEHIINLIGKQNFNLTEKYRFLHFCIIIPYNDKVLLFNNLTKEYLVLEKKEFDKFKNTNFTSPDEIVKILVEKWFLVPENFNDLKLCEQIRNTLLLFETNKGINNYTILPTTGCNARCFYCFEAGTPIINMDINTANAVSDYIIRNCKGQRVLLRWFGGEPLCNHRVIDLICEKLRQNNIQYYSHMTTNGYLFDKELAKKAVELWQINSVQITLDGMADTYNRVKNFVNNDKNAFDKVIENIRILCENKVTVRVRLNIDSHNYDEIISLIEYLNDRFSEYKNGQFMIYIFPLFETNGYSRDEVERIELTQRVIDLSNYINNIGFAKGNKRINAIATSSCMADRKNDVLILPDGRLGFCEHNVSSDVYGSIFEDAKKPNWSPYIKRYEECKTCAYLPNCLKLEKCPSAGDKCHEYTRFLNINKIINGVIEFYEKYLNSLDNNS